MVPSSPWWGEHRSRYHFAARYARSGKVLDIACGTGYGSRILIDAGAELVVGMDLSPEALAEAAKEPKSGPIICRADATAIPLRTESVDLVTSFETIEHLTHDVEYLSELHRVLRPSGVLLLSTPNALRSNPTGGRPANPFHVREYRPEDLKRLLGKYFSEVSLLGQKTDPRFGFSPFWDDLSERPRGARSTLSVAAWLVAHRLPFALKDRTSRLRHNRPFYPGEYDFIFAPEFLRSAHVTVAVCRKG